MKLQRIFAAAGAVVVLAISSTVITAASASANIIYGISGDFNYSVNDGIHASIDNYRSSAPDVVIPEVVDGYPVNAIGVRAFQDRNLTSVTLPEGIILIDSLAFNRTHLTSVTLPSTLAKIGGEAFSECLLTAITIPASVTIIENHAFYAQPTLHSARFLGDAPEMNATVFSGVATDFAVSYPYGKTGYGSGDTWLGFPKDLPYSTALSAVTAGITAGKLSATLTAPAFDPVIFSHGEQNPTTTATLTIDDLTGANAGWSVTESASDLVWSAITGGPTTGADLPASALSITDVSAVTATLGDPWAGESSIGSLGSPVAVLATGTGNGSYFVRLTFTLTIPGQAAVGTYAGTITTTIAAAP